MVTIKKGASEAVNIKAEMLVVGAVKDRALAGSAAQVDNALDGALTKHLGKSSFKAEVGETVVVPTMGRIRAPAVMVVGLGPQEKLRHEQVRRAAGAAARQCGQYGVVAVDIAGGVEGGPAAAAEGFALGGYSFSRYKSDPNKQTNQAIIAGAGKADVERAEATADATTWARDIVNEPPSNRGPEAFVQAARQRAPSAIKVQVFDEKALEKKGMNGILTVGRGSDSPPRLAVLTYSPPRAKGFVGLVGKGITFDSGGLSLKSSEGMETMKMDCSGAAAVIAAVTALPALGPPIKVVAAVALAENMPGSNAVKPGDVIRHFGGRTSEVLNTDAEGRLVLADVLAWMSSQGPDAMVDVATLTGGMVVALGQKVAGVLANDPALADEMLAASARSGEPLWQMPLIDEYRKQIDSSVADIKNISDGRWASPIFGGLFLRDFVGDTPWAHLDIAGPAWADKPEHYLSQGATGFGARLLIDWIMGRANGA